VVLRLSRRQDYEHLRHTHAEFLQVVSHDLRSPLATIGLAASALASGDLGTLSAGQQAMLGKISSAADSMARLVENIQAAGRYDPGTGLYEMDLQPVDLLELVQRVVEELVIPPDKPAQRVEMALAADVPLIRADAGMLERAIVNLLDNAVKYTPDGGTIRVELIADDSAVTLSVADSGPGIPLADRERVFEKHVRLVRSETRRVRGSGLGLFIVRSVAERHGGRALLESDEGKGSTFRLRLPASGPTVAGDAS
jgi:two-component system sensor histidine kinase VicK